MGDASRGNGGGLAPNQALFLGLSRISVRCVVGYCIFEPQTHVKGILSGRTANALCQGYKRRHPTGTSNERLAQTTRTKTSRRFVGVYNVHGASTATLYKHTSKVLHRSQQNLPHFGEKRLSELVLRRPVLSGRSAPSLLVFIAPFPFFPFPPVS